MLQEGCCQHQGGGTACTQQVHRASGAPKAPRAQTSGGMETTPAGQVHWRPMLLHQSGQCICLTILTISKPPHAHVLLSILWKPSVLRPTCWCYLLTTCPQHLRHIGFTQATMCFQHDVAPLLVCMGDSTVQSCSGRAIFPCLGLTICRQCKPQ